MNLAFPDYIDSSMLTTWRACKRKHLWSNLHALYPTGASVHLVAGAAIASGMESVRKYVFARPAPTSHDLSTLLEVAYPSFAKEWGDYEAPENHAKSFNNTWRALEYYLSEYPPLTDPIQPYSRPDGSPAVEYTFSIPLPINHPVSKSPLLFVGRFDMLGVYRVPSGLVPLIVDEKTTGAFSFSWSDSWDMRGQFLGYIWAAQSAGLDVRHAAVRGIAIQKTQTQVRTAFIEYPQHRIDAWERQMLRDINHMVNSFIYITEHAHNHEEFYPFNFGDSCSSYGGCAFQTLCTVSDPEPFFTNYIKHRFNPLLKQPIEELTPQ